MMDKDRFSDFYQGMAQWLTDVKKHEVTQIVELVEQAKALLVAMEQLPEEKMKQFVDNFTYDLHEFYLQNQEQAKHSIYLALMRESFWALMAKITDQSQVEWAELTDDFKHHGVYKSGDVIGFGLLQCRQCRQSTPVTHMAKVVDCIHCGHNEFTRISLTP
ncbi:zinc ribbon-containing protein [Thalassotalea marina]|nr:zinc ribbon-containing protein [Thalassotalea marina]